MAWEQTLSRIFQLNDKAWMRHANPWSVWTRYSVLPFLVLAIWSKAWIGGFCLGPIALSLLWMFLNPHVFPKPASTKNWASMAVLGERVYLQRDTRKLPDVHNSMIFGLLKVIAGAGFFMALYGAIFEVFHCVFFGTLVAIIAKSWFLDRMVWLYCDMVEHHPEYKRWLY